MATVLSKYAQFRDNLQEQIRQGKLPCNQILLYQEVLYRISVLETFQAFCKIAPVSTDVKQLTYHYQMVDAYIASMLTEHKLGQPADAQQKAKRETASKSLHNIVQGCRKTFSNFKPVTEDLYKTNISALVKTILPVWVQYRDEYIKL